MSVFICCCWQSWDLFEKQHERDVDSGKKDPRAKADLLMANLSFEQRPPFGYLSMFNIRLRVFNIQRGPHTSENERGRFRAVFDDNHALSFQI